MTHFIWHVRAKMAYATESCCNETCRLYSDFETQLSASSSGFVLSKHHDRRYLIWRMAAASRRATIGLAEIMTVRRWSERLLPRPSIAQETNVPERHLIQFLMDDKMGQKAKQFDKYSSSRILVEMRKAAAKCY